MRTRDFVEPGPAELFSARAETRTLPAGSLRQRRMVRALAVVGLLRFPQVPEATELVRHLQLQFDGDPISAVGAARNNGTELAHQTGAAVEPAQTPDRVARCSIGSLLRRNRSARTASRPSAT